MIVGLLRIVRAIVSFIMPPCPTCEAEGHECRQCWENRQW